MVLGLDLFVKVSWEVSENKALSLGSPQLWKVDIDGQIQES